MFINLPTARRDLLSTAPASFGLSYRILQCMSAPPGNVYSLRPTPEEIGCGDPHLISEEIGRPLSSGSA